MKVLLANILLSSSLKSFFELIALLLIFVFVLLVTYAATKWMAGYQKAHYANKNLKVIETVPVGNNKMISLVEAGEVYLVVSIGKDEVNLLAQLTKEQLKDFSLKIFSFGVGRVCGSSLPNEFKIYFVL